jgi:hypothetical protein
VYAMETTSRSECYAHVQFPEKVALVLGKFIFIFVHLFLH